ncbi:Uncharacterized protein PCOAH_00006240 [Plasmodium coatneyi]|uniref:Uncharacterized protein n=1 Tax=Plasmodium coatneyi TaxID=208452 RepID=A0A1B1DTK0_9APIC|nr:Uncharacterized protein PCOAH_00006240 [Plasmodium coatneyi]ANQ06100.1 Uncharacterized protein PCOAH_00006240 [Plasmodium coatneyi]
MLLKNNLPIISTGIIKKFPQIGRTNMLPSYAKVLIFSFFFWNSSNSNDSLCIKSCDEKNCERSIFSVKKFRVLTEYNGYESGSYSSLDSLEDMEDDEREERLRELISYYNVFLNYYPELNTKDKIIKIKNPELPLAGTYASNGKEHVPQYPSEPERSYGYDEVDSNLEDEDEYEEFEILIEAEPIEEADYLEEYVDLDIDMDDKELTALDGIYEEGMSTFKRKYLEIMNKFIAYINNLKWNSESVHDYILLFTQINILIILFFLHLAARNVFISMGVAALALFVI